MKNKRRSIIPGMFCAVTLAVTPLSAGAEGEGLPEPEPAPMPASVVITEVQTGAAAGGDEFIELHNVSAAPVDITGWQVRYANASNATTTKVATVAGAAGGAVILQPGEYYTLYDLDAVPEGLAGQPYSATLSQADKTVVLFAVDLSTCQLVVADAVAWVTPAADPVQTKPTFGEGQPVDAAEVGSNDKLLRRVQDSSGKYVDTNNNNFDFVVTAAGKAAPLAQHATLGGDNQLFLPEATVVPDAGEGSPLAPIPIDGCIIESPASPDETEPPVAASPDESPPAIIEPPAAQPQDAAPQPTIPAANAGLKPPLLSELLPNPASPQTDKDDEFIELYNPNEAYFDLSGYVLEVGLKTKRRYTIPAGTKLPPKTFTAFFSAQTGLALSNSGSQVALLDPLGRTLAVSEPYGTAKDGQAWVFASGIWQWTTKPTPNALNVVSAPAVKSKSTAKKSSVSAASATKTGSGSQSGGIELVEGIEDAAAVATISSTSLHPGVLALVVVSAVLYGAYEYRRDVANRIYQFRTNRAARRALRQSAKGS